ncbi:MAG: LPS export ABC transporter periplasmic protein LptC [Armatimonadota bacterium]|nr:LPS export ABC transporter periplasmic protein LptC [bacterium]
MGHKLHIRIVVMILAVLSLIALGLRNYSPYAARGARPKQAPTVVLAMEDVYLVGLGHNGKLWSAKADKVEIGRDRSITELDKIHDARIYDSGKVALKAKAGKAIYNTRRKNLSLGGGVEIVGSNGQKVTGEGAVWSSSNAMLRSVGPVKFDGKMGNVVADRLVVDLKSQELGMWNVSMKIRLDALNDDAMEAR